MQMPEILESNPTVPCGPALSRALWQLSMVKKILPLALSISTVDRHEVELSSTSVQYCTGVLHVVQLYNLYTVTRSKFRDGDWMAPLVFAHKVHA